MTIFELDIWGIHIAPTYYGAMYAIAFFCAYWYLKKNMQISEKKLDTLFLYLVLGVIVGGRLGYVILYNLPFYLQNPLDIIKTWDGGMSFHGGLLGVIFAGYIFSKRYQYGFLGLMDHLAVIAPVGLFLGRIGNYINKELLGFPGYYGPFAVEIAEVSYFPSALLEALLEGVALFCVLFFLRKHRFWEHKLGVLFLLLYGCFRFFVEFFRLPDAHIGYIYGGWMTLGHVYSFCMIFVGILLFFTIGKRMEQPSSK